MSSVNLTLISVNQSAKCICKLSSSFLHSIRNLGASVQVLPQLADFCLCRPEFYYFLIEIIFLFNHNHAD